MGQEGDILRETRIQSLKAYVNFDENLKISTKKNRDAPNNIPVTRVSSAEPEVDAPPKS